MKAMNGTHVVNVTPKAWEGLQLLYQAALGEYVRLPDKTLSLAAGCLCRGLMPLVERAPAPPPHPEGTTVYRLTNNGRAFVRSHL